MIETILARKYWRISGYGIKWAWKDYKKFNGLRVLGFRLTKGISNHRDHFVNEIQSLSCRLYPKESSERPNQPERNIMGTLPKGCCIAVSVFWIQSEGKEGKWWSAIAVFGSMPFARPESESLKIRRFPSHGWNCCYYGSNLVRFSIFPFSDVEGVNWRA